MDIYLRGNCIHAIAFSCIYSYYRFQEEKITKAGDSYSPGGRLNKKDGLTRYGDSYVKDKTS